MKTLVDVVTEFYSDGDEEEAVRLVQSGRVEHDRLAGEAIRAFHYDVLHVWHSDGHRQRECLEYLRALDVTRAREFVNIHSEYSEAFQGLLMTGERPRACCDTVREVYRRRDRRS